MKEKGNIKEMTYSIERIFDEVYDEEYAKGYAKGIEIGKREAAKAVIGLLDDEIIAEKIDLNLEEIRQLREC